MNDSIMSEIIPVSSDNIFVGTKVTRGPDWGFYDQDEDSDYGIVTGSPYTSYTSDGSPLSWVTVNWVKENGTVVNSDSYPVYDQSLAYYVDPIEILLSELNKLEKSL